MKRGGLEIEREKPLFILILKYYYYSGHVENV